MIWKYIIISIVICAVLCRTLSKWHWENYVFLFAGTAAVLGMLVLGWILSAFGVNEGRNKHYTKEEAETYLKEAFPQEETRLTGEEQAYWCARGLEKVWPAEMESKPGMQFYVISMPDQDGTPHRKYKLTDTYQDACCRYLAETGDFPHLRTETLYGMGIEGRVAMVFESVEDIENGGWLYEQQMYARLVKENGISPYYTYGCLSYNPKLTGWKYESLFVDSRIREDWDEEAMELLKQHYREYQIAFCRTQQWDEDEIKETVEKSKLKFYSEYKGEKRQQEKYLAVPGYVEPGGAYAITIETMYSLLTDYGLEVKGDRDYFEFTGIDRRKYIFSTGFIDRKNKRSYPEYYYLKDGWKKWLDRSRLLYLGSQYVTSEVLSELTGISFEVVE